MSVTVQCRGGITVESASYVCNAAGKKISEAWFAKYCSKDYEDAGGEGFGHCPIFQKYVKPHIVTSVCKTLNKPEYIKIANKFKIKLITSGKYQQQLAIYDKIGPVIADRIRGNERICKMLFERTIKPVCELIKAGQDEVALKQFIDMVTQFIEPEYRTNQGNCRPNEAFTESMHCDSKTIGECKQAATVGLLEHRINTLTAQKQPEDYLREFPLKPKPDGYQHLLSMKPQYGRM